jgi:energy-coupling factor transporter ATP-binding protein EcfA2
VSPIEYLEEPLLPVSALIGITGDAGCGKSTLLCALAGKISARGIPALILDRDNPLPVIHSRFERLGIRDGPMFGIWGGWCKQEPPGFDSPVLLSLATTCEPKPLIILDCLGAFYEGDENDASTMRGFLRPARNLTNLGCTVAVIHNDGKSESAREYRGSKAFKDAVDVAFHVTNNRKDGPLDVLTVRSYKSRFGFTGALVYRYANGKVVRADAPANPATPDHTSALRQLLAGHCGIGSREFIKLALDNQIPERASRAFLKDGISSSEIRCQGNQSTGLAHFLVEGTL